MCKKIKYCFFCLWDLKRSDIQNNWCWLTLRRVRKKYSEILKYRENRSITVVVRWNPARLKRLFSHFNSLVLHSLLLQEASGAQTCERNNVVKREGLRAARSRQIRVEIDLITSGFLPRCSFYLTAELNSRGPKEIKSPSERETRLRIRMSANQSFDYNIEIRRCGEEDAWFHLPVANRNRNPVQTATIDIYYVDRGEPNWPRTRPLRALKSKRPNATNPSYLVHSALRDLRFPSRNFAR